MHKQGKRTEIEMSQAKESFAEVSGSKPRAARPWERHIKDRHEKIKKTWQDYAARLESSGNVDGKKEAEAIRCFVNEFPQAETRREQLDESMAKALAKRLENNHKQAIEKQSEPEKKSDSGAGAQATSPSTKESSTSAPER